MRLFGYTKMVNTMMDAADLLITKPGGLTSSEALAKGLPMIITNPIPGQEERNARYLLKHGVAEEADDPRGYREDGAVSLEPSHETKENVGEDKRDRHALRGDGSGTACVPADSRRQCNMIEFSRILTRARAEECYAERIGA